MGKPKRSGIGFSASHPEQASKLRVAKNSADHAAKEQQALALINQGRLQEAEEIYRELIRQETSNHIVYGNLAAICGMQGRHQDMIKLLHKTLEIHPNYPDAHFNLGNALHGQGELAAAITCYTKAIALKPNDPEAHNNLGNANREQGNLTAAIASYNKALELNPNHPGSHYNLGIAHKEQAELSSAITFFKKALLINPNYVEAHWNLSLTLLLSGDYKTGWEEYEWRAKREHNISTPHTTAPCQEWDGSMQAPSNQLLLISEQGLGDTLQFMRYAIALRKQGVAVSLCADTKLHSLIQASGIDSSPLDPEQVNQITAGQWITLLSVPRHLEVSPENPIITEPYINSTDGLIAKWKDILSAEKHKIIAINWQGDPETEKLELKGRSFPLETFAPIAHIKNASLLSLQKGFGSEQLETCSFKDSFVSCQDQVNDTWDFLETAAIITNCDLVITSDTSVAHLAGGMGKTTWLLLKKVPEWRWGLEGDTTFWYPSMRLFRQEVRGDWDEVMERVAEELQKLFGYTSTIIQSFSPPAPES